LARTTVGRAAHRMAQPAALAEQLYQRTAFGIHISAVVVRDMLCGPRIQLGFKLTVLVIKERPLQVVLVAHVSCPRIPVFAWRRTRGTPARSLRSACRWPALAPRPRS